MKKNYIQKIVHRLDEKFAEYLGCSVEHCTKSREEGVGNKTDVTGNYAVLVILKGEDITLDDLHHMYSAWEYAQDKQSPHVYLARKQMIDENGCLGDVIDDLGRVYVRFLKEIAVEIKEGKLELE